MIRVAVIGLGNCASALIQGLEYYQEYSSTEGLMRSKIGPYSPRDITVGLAFDIDARKVHKPIREAIWSKPNCCYKMVESVHNGGPVMLAPRLDGVAEHMAALDLGSRRFVPSNDEPDFQTIQEAAEILHRHEIDILVNYLPVGSTEATHFWAETALLAKIPFLNCIPVFIASDPAWSERFRAAGIPVLGDDMKSQFGASVLSQMFEELATLRGHKVLSHIQQNSGGNTDFLNMMDKNRILDKKISKENVIRNASSTDHFLHAGPSDYISILGDKKIAYFNLELEGFGGSPVTLEAKLTVQDSPNSAGVVIDAIRYLKVAHDRGLSGALEGPSAFTQKSPPRPMTLQEATLECSKY
jgi:myo-inositol-1-phosphate synthase